MTECKLTQILVLDGDDVSRKKLCDMLRELGVSDDDLICTVTIKQALDVLETGRVSLVIVDASDAIRQEYSVCSLLGVSPGTKVVLNAWIHELGPIRAAAIRVHGLIQKPISKKDVKWYLDISLKIRVLDKKLSHIMQAMSTDNAACSDCPNNRV